MRKGNSITSRRLRTALWGIAVVWTVLLAAALVISLRLLDHGTIETANSLAMAAFEKDIHYCRWVAGLGGIYARQTETTPPNPYLDVPERDITTPSGTSLTLINPAYMTRLVHELAKQKTGISYSGHFILQQHLRVF